MNRAVLSPLLQQIQFKKKNYCYNPLANYPQIYIGVSQRPSSVSFRTTAPLKTVALEHFKQQMLLHLLERIQNHDPCKHVRANCWLLYNADGLLADEYSNYFRIISENPDFSSVYSYYYNSIRAIAGPYSPFSVIRERDSLDGVRETNDEGVKR